MYACKQAYMLSSNALILGLRSGIFPGWEGHACRRRLEHANAMSDRAMRSRHVSLRHPPSPDARRVSGSDAGDRAEACKHMTIAGWRYDR